MKQSALFFGGVLLLWGFFSVSCVRQEYALDDLDMTVNVGGDSLALPLGVTDTIYAGSLLSDADDEAQSFLKVLADGTLAITQNGNMAMEVPEVDAAGLTILDFSGSTHCSPTFEAAPQSEAVSAKSGSFLKAPVSATLPVTSGINDIAPEVKRIDYIALGDEAVLLFTFEISELRSLSDVMVEMDIWVTLPDYIKPTASVTLENGKLRIRQALENGKLVYPMPLAGFDFSQHPLVDRQLVLNDKIPYEGNLRVIAEDASVLAAWGGRTLAMETNYEITHLTPVLFEGLFEPDLEPTVETVALDDIPEMLTGEDMVFDFYAPYLLISIPTNTGLALQNELTVTPVVQGVPQTDRAVQAQLPLAARPDAQMETTRYCLSNRQPAALTGDYTFVECDLAGLLRHIPNALQISLTTTADETAAMVYDFNVHYTAAVNYDFIVPMSFGEELHLSLGDTIDGLPELVNEILSKNELHIGGTAWNTMPVDLELTVIALDADRKEVPMETQPQRIKAGTPTGEAVATALDLMLGDRTGASARRPIQALALQFTLTTGEGNIGVPLKNTSWVRAKLKAKVPGGITVDLRDLKDEE